MIAHPQFNSRPGHPELVEGSVLPAPLRLAAELILRQAQDDGRGGKAELQQWSCADNCVPKWNLGTRGKKAGRATVRDRRYSEIFASLRMPDFRKAAFATGLAITGLGFSMIRAAADEETTGSYAPQWKDSGKVAINIHSLGDFPHGPLDALKAHLIPPPQPIKIKFDPQTGSHHPVEGNR
jgi:hypothetical protein